MSSSTVTKTLAAVNSVEDPEHPNGAFEVVISDDSLDRDGEVIAKGAFEPLPDHLSADVDHGMSVVTTVGSGQPYTRDDGSVAVKGTFASTELGQATRTLVREGHIRTASVAFIRKEVSGKSAAGPNTVTKGELLNFAFTPVPSNKNAAVLSAKSFAALDEARDELRGETSRPRTKSIVGSVEALQDRVRDALQAAYARDSRWYWSGWVRGVVLNDAHDGGTVVFDADGTVLTAGTYRHTTWSQQFTDDGDLATLTGDPTEVDVAEVVLPDAESARAGTKTAAPTGTPPTPVADPPAVKAAGSPADAAGNTPDDELQIRAQGIALRALAHG